MLESTFQARLVKKLEALFQGCVIMKNDPNYRQGFPDLLILFNNAWAVLECKASWDAPYQPNQEWYLDKLRAMSFSATIFPENESEVLTALREFFGT